MARNYFSSGGDAMDVINAGQQGWTDTQDSIDGILRKRAGYRAAPKIAQGDYAGAAQEYGAMGLDKEALAMRGQQEDATRQQDTHDLETSKRNLEVLGELTHDLARVPEGQRAPVLQSRLQILQHIGIDPTPFAQLTEDQLTNDNLRPFAQELKNAYQVIKRGNDGYDVLDMQNGGNIVRSVEPTQKDTPPGMFVRDPNTGEWVVNPLFVQGKARVAAATRAPLRAGVGGGGGGLGGVKTADLIAALRGGR